MGLDEIRKFERSTKKVTAIERMWQQGLLAEQDMGTLVEAKGAVRSGELTFAAVSRWLNAKDGVQVSTAAVRAWLLADD